MTPKVPGDILAALDRQESVKRVAAARLLAHPTAREGLGVVAVLTSDRLFLLPGAEGSPDSRMPVDHVGHIIVDLWRMVKRATDPMAQPESERRSAIEIPLTELRKAHETRDPSTFGLEMTLPLPDPRPPWSLYVELMAPTERNAWIEQLEVLRTAAAPRPDRERPYSLYYLTRELPHPAVKLKAPDGRTRRGFLTAGGDGLNFGSLGRPAPLLGYESIDAVEWSDPSALRAPKVTFTAAEREWVVVPRNNGHIDALRDLSRLAAEGAGAQLDSKTGDLRTGRIAWALAAGSSAAAAVAEWLIF